MTQTPEELAAPIVAEMKSAGKFDLSAALKKTSYPVKDVTVYLDGYKAHELNELLDEVSELEHKAVGYSALAQGSMVDAPEKEAIDAEIAELKARELELIKEISGSALTFTLRGLAPAQWRLIDKEARRKIKPESKSEDDVLEAQIERNKRVNIEIVAKGIVKVTDANGDVSEGAITLEASEGMYDGLLEPEWMKLQDNIQNLTFANTVFQNVAMQDADFLSKSSADLDSQATSD